VPIDFWATAEVQAALLKHFSFASAEPLLERLGVDFRYIEGPGTSPRAGRAPTAQRRTISACPASWVRYGAGSQSGLVCRGDRVSPGARGSADEVERYAKWPRAGVVRLRVRGGAGRQARGDGQGGRVSSGDRLNRCAQLKPPCTCAASEQILVDMLVNPDVARAIFRRITDFYVEYARRNARGGRGEHRHLLHRDDFGMQITCSCRRRRGRGSCGRLPAVHRPRPRLRCRVAHHTCGCVAPLIRDFVECGLDILNPLQPTRGHGLRADQARVRPADRVPRRDLDPEDHAYGTPEDVVREVRDRREALAPGGGYIFCTAHNIQVDTPIRNIEAAVRGLPGTGRVWRAALRPRRRAGIILLARRDSMSILAGRMSKDSFRRPMKGSSSPASPGEQPPREGMDGQPDDRQHNVPRSIPAFEARTPMSESQ